jgi:hypothetical protein
LRRYFGVYGKQRFNRHTITTRQAVERLTLFYLMNATNARLGCSKLTTKGEKKEQTYADRILYHNQMEINLRKNKHLIKEKRTFEGKF